MGIVNDIVREQVKFLQPRGFGVEAMGNTEGPAMFERQLREGLEELLHDDLEWVVPMPVRAVNIGKFEKGKYTVQFTFDYEFEPLQQVLSLKGIEARLGENTMPITLQDLLEYRRAGEFFEKLQNLHVITDHHEQVQFQQTIAKLLQQNKELIIKQGYSETKLDEPQIKGALERRLENKLNWAVSVATDQKPIQRFKLLAKGPANNERPKAEFIVFFEYNKTHPSLRPRSVTAKVDGQTVNLKCNSNIPLPSTDMMYMLATGKLDMKKAQALLQFKHDYSLKRVRRGPK